MALRSPWGDFPQGQSCLHFYPPFLASTLPTLEFLQMTTVFGFQPGQTKKRDFFFCLLLLNGISWFYLLGHALDIVGLVGTLNSEHIGLLALLNPFPYPEYKLHPSPDPPKPFNLWVILQPIPS